MGNILDNYKGDLTTNWQVLFNTRDPKIKSKTKSAIPYDQDDQTFIAGLATARYNFLSNNQKNIQDILEIIKSIKQIAERSREKELDFLLELFKKQKFSNQKKEDLWELIGDFYERTFSYFNQLAQLQDIKIQYTAKEKLAINTLFWGDIGTVTQTTDSKGNKKEQTIFTKRGHFIAAVAALRAQSFFERFVIQATTTNTEEEVIKELGKQLGTISNSVNDVPRNWPTEIRDLVQTIKDIKDNQVNSNKNNYNEIADLIIQKVFDNINEQLSQLNLYKAVQAAVDKETDPSTAGSAIKNKINSGNSSSQNKTQLGQIISDQFRLEIRKNIYQVINQTPILVIRDRRKLQTTIAGQLKKNTEVRTIISTILPYIVAQCSQNRSDKKEYNIQVVDLVKESDLIDKITAIFSDNVNVYSDATDTKILKRLYKIAKQNIKQNILKLLDIWINMISTEILKLKSVSENLGFNVVEANEYFLKHVAHNNGKDISKTIIKDLDMPGSDLEFEIFRAIDKYIKVSWNSSHASNYNGTISEILITYLLREIFEEVADPQMVLQRGGGAQDEEDSKQSITDIDVLYKEKQNQPGKDGIGMQAKHYKDNKINLYPTENIVIYNAQRYLSQADINAFLFLMGNDAILKQVGCPERTSDDFSYLIPLLYYRLTGFFRFDNPGALNALQNNFYIFNFNVIPASVLFLFVAYKIYEDSKQNENKSITEWQRLFVLDGDTKENNYRGKDYSNNNHYNLFNSFLDYNKEVSDPDTNENIAKKLQTFKITFKGQTINIDSLNLSVFQKK